MPDMFVSNARRRRRRWPFVVGGVIVLGAAAAFGAYLLFFQKEGDFSNPNAEFQTQPKPPPPPKKKSETFKWPIYGYTPDRARFLDVNLRPPFRKLWRFTKGHGLIEFQPILANGVL